jgi:hypothetical protein
MVSGCTAFVTPMIPKIHWLSKNGYGGLLYVMEKSPELFSHIEQERGHKTPQEWVAVAEQLAADNGGVLPHPKKLQNTGYAQLWNIKKQSPALFLHIKQTDGLEARKQKPKTQWVQIAARLAAENGGTVPGRGWLIKNGHSGLYYAIRRKPEMFSKIRHTIKIRESKTA